MRDLTGAGCRSTGTRFWDRRVVQCKLFDYEINSNKKRFKYYLRESPSSSNGCLAGDSGHLDVPLAKGKSLN